MRTRIFIPNRISNTTKTSSRSLVRDTVSSLALRTKTLGICLLRKSAKKLVLSEKTSTWENQSSSLTIKWGLTSQRLARLLSTLQSQLSTSRLWVQSGREPKWSMFWMWGRMSSRVIESSEGTSIWKSAIRKSEPTILILSFLSWVRNKPWIVRRS